MTLVAVGLLGFAGFQRTQAPASSRSAASETSSVRQLRSLLGQLRACVAPAQRKVTVEQLRPRAESLRTAMELVLAQPSHALFEDTATLAAELGFDEFEDAMRSALNVAKDDVQATLWVAIDTLRPLTHSELELLLQQSSPQVAEAGLRILRGRCDTPEELVDDVLACVRSEHRRVRALALACTPESLDAAHADLVLALAEEAPEDAEIAALLGRVPVTDRGMQAIVDRVRASDAEAIARMQPALVRYAAQPQIRTALWSMAADIDDEARAERALQCIEVAGVSDPAPQGAASWPPRLQYRLARIRVRNHDLVGIDAMIRLVEEGASDAATASAASAAADSRLSLAAIGHLAPHATIEELRAWRTGLVAVPNEPLPAR